MTSRWHHNRAQPWPVPNPTWPPPASPGSCSGCVSSVVIFCPSPQHSEIPLAPFLQGMFVHLHLHMAGWGFLGGFQCKVREHLKFHESQGDAGGCGNKSKGQQWPEAEQEEGKSCLILLFYKNLLTKLEDQRNHGKKFVTTPKQRLSDFMGARMPLFSARVGLVLPSFSRLL